MATAPVTPLPSDACASSSTRRERKRRATEALLPWDDYTTSLMRLPAAYP